MKMQQDQLSLLGLSKKEASVLDAVYAGATTPLRIHRSTRVNRPTIYQVLPRLQKRGLITQTIRDGKKHWAPTHQKKLEQSLFNSKKQLFGITEGVDEVRGLDDSMILLHRGKKAIRELILSIIRDHKEQRIYGIQGDIENIGWNKIFSEESTNEINRWIKKNKVIVEGVVPYGWHARHAKQLGRKWAESFEGRAAITHEIDEKYFKHGGQMWIMKDSLYLIAMNEEIAIEIRNSEIQKMILSLLGYIQDTAHKIDVNAILRDLILDGKNK